MRGSPISLKRPPLQLRKAHERDAEKPAYLVALAAAEYASGGKAEVERTQAQAVSAYQQVWEELRPLFDQAGIAVASRHYAETREELQRLSR